MNLQGSMLREKNPKVYIQYDSIYNIFMRKKFKVENRASGC